MITLLKGKSKPATEFPPASKKGLGTKSNKRALLLFLRAHFCFPKALLNLKVYDTFNMQTNIVKRHPFPLFFTKGRKGCYFFYMRDNKGAIHSMKRVSQDFSLVDRI